MTRGNMISFSILRKSSPHIAIQALASYPNWAGLRANPTTTPSITAVSVANTIAFFLAQFFAFGGVHLQWHPLCRRRVILAPTREPSKGLFASSSAIVPQFPGKTETYGWSWSYAVTTATLTCTFTRLCYSTYTCRPYYQAISTRLTASRGFYI